jgi:acylpyruvate hydrolase
MRFYCFESDGTAHLGVGTPDGKRLLDLAAAAPELPKNHLEFVAGFAWIQPVVTQVIQSKQSSNWIYDLESLRLLAPIPRPGKILCSGINYRSHLQENPDAKPGDVVRSEADQIGVLQNSVTRDDERTQ